MPLESKITPMSKSLETEIKVGLFVAIGVFLLMLSIMALGNSESIFSRTHRHIVRFASVDGLITGAKTVVGGLAVGSVSKIELDPATRNIAVTLSVESKYASWLRKDSEAEIATQGVLGDKYIVLTMGTPESPELPNGEEIPMRAGKDFSQFLSKGDQLLVSINSIAGSLDRILKEFEAGNKSSTLFGGLASTAKNLAGVTEKLNGQLEGDSLKNALKAFNSILQKIDRGNGTVGALINDPALYDDAKALVGGANHNRILRNMVRQTIKDNQAKDAEDQKNDGK